TRIWVRAGRGLPPLWNRCGPCRFPCRGFSDRRGPFTCLPACFGGWGGRGSGSSCSFGGCAHCTRNQSVRTESLPGWWWWRGRRSDVRGEGGESFDPAALIRFPNRQRPARATAAGGRLADRRAPDERHRRPDPHYAGPTSAPTTLSPGAYRPDHLLPLQRGVPLSFTHCQAGVRVSAIRSGLEIGVDARLLAGSGTARAIHSAGALRSLCELSSLLAAAMVPARTLARRPVQGALQDRDQPGFREEPGGLCSGLAR